MTKQTRNQNLFTLQRLNYMSCAAACRARPPPLLSDPPLILERFTRMCLQVRGARAIMTVREIDVAKLYEELMAFDRYLEMMEPNNDGASPSGGPSSRPAGSRPVSGEVPAPNGVEPASEATVVTPGNDGGKEDVVKPQVAIRPLEGEKMAEVKQRVCTAVQSTIGLILILIAYSFLGAALLNFTESFQEETNFNELDHVKQSVIADIINVTRSASRHKRDINTTVDPFGAGSDVWQAVDELLTTYTSAKESLRPYSNSPGWSFWGALFYCGTVYTTVGTIFQPSCCFFEFFVSKSASHLPVQYT